MCFCTKFVEIWIHIYKMFDQIGTQIGTESNLLIISGGAAWIFFYLA